MLYFDQIAKRIRFLFRINVVLLASIFIRIEGSSIVIFIFAELLGANIIKVH